MKASSKFAELAVVAATYSIDLIASVAMSLVLPAFVSVDTYAVLRLFLLYVTFVSVCNLGFNDGVYVKYGAYDYDDLPKDAMHSFLRHVMLQGVMFGSLLGVLGLSGLLGGNGFVCIFLGANLLILNLNGLYVFINQFTKRFSINLINNGVSKLVQTALVVGLLIAGVDSAYPFILSITAANALCLFMNIIRNRSILLARPLLRKVTVPLLKKCYKSGFAIMIGYYASQLILTSGQFAVSYTCTTEDFAYFSFAFSVMSFLNVFVNSVSTWLYPTMKRKHVHGSLAGWLGSVSILSGVALSLLLSAGFLLVTFIPFAIPKYSASIDYLIILFPTVAYNGVIRMVFGNVYKACELERQYMTINSGAGLVSVILVFALSYTFPGQTTLIAMAVSLTVVIQYLLLSCNLREQISLRTRFSTFLVVSISSLGFELIAHMNMDHLSMFLTYLAVSVVLAGICCLLFKKEVNFL